MTDLKQNRDMPALFRCLTAMVVATQLSACAHPPQTASVPSATPSAPFSVSETTGRGSDCEFTLHLDGTVYPRSGELELVIPRGSVAITRVNNKQMDYLQMQIGVGGRPSPTGRLVVMRGKTTPVVLSPTVDSAGPQLTTWQSDDTLRLLMPSRPSTSPQWLYFTLGYMTVSYDGQIKRCSGFLHSDSLQTGAP